MGHAPESWPCVSWRAPSFGGVYAEPMPSSKTLRSVLCTPRLISTQKSPFLPRSKPRLRVYSKKSSF
jgi:hypothetical protein